MGFQLSYVNVKTAMSKSNLPGLDYSLNPYIGCYHSCIYCYARLYCKPEIAERWGEIVVVKKNIVELLKKELREKNRGVVGLSTITDAYQPIEAKELITRQVLEILLKNNFSVSIQTKSALLLRDVDLISENKEKVDVGVTITTLDENLAKLIEPRASKPADRVKVLEKLSSEKIKTWIFLGPIIPDLNEEDIKAIIEIAKSTNSSLYYDRFRIKPFMKTGLVKELAEKSKKVDWQEVALKIRKFCFDAGVESISAF
ncbi:MAG: radical SAM protein [Archaeoglobaceae archaeon]